MASRLATVSSRGEDGKFSDFAIAPPSDPEFYGMGHALYSTAPDFMRLLRMYLNKGQLEGKRLLSEKAVQSLLSIALELSEGLWLVMAGETQRFWVHQVPKTTAAVERRINLTFRRMTPVHQPRQAPQWS